MTTNPNPNGEEGDKLYANKFKTVEDLENGYKNAAVVYDENTNLKKKVEELSAVPDSYQNPSDVEMDSNRLTDIQARAKESDMTQAQYEKFVRSDKARVDKSKETFENAKKELGEANMNILQDYVSKHYPKEIGDGVLRTLIQNKEARTAALAHREKLLNNQVPGVSNVGGGYHSVSDEDIKKAYVAKEKSKSSKDIQKYLNLVATQAAQQRAN